MKLLLCWIASGNTLAMTGGFTPFGGGAAAAVLSKAGLACNNRREGTVSDTQLKYIKIKGKWPIYHIRGIAQQLQTCTFALMFEPNAARKPARTHNR
jgi:hypothetical protein